MSENYSEAERRLIESRSQPVSNQGAAPFSVDQPSVPRIDKKPEAKDVDLKGMVNKVNEASKLQQANSPTVFDTIDKDMPWLKWVTGTLGVLGAAYGVNKLLGDGDDNIPPDNNNPPNNRPPSPKDRSLTRTEPTFNSAETAQSSMTAGEPKIVADPIPVAPKPVTDVVTVPGTPDTTASIIPTTDQPKVVPMPSEARPPMQYGETKYNVPTASPEVAVAPPAEVAPAPVQPKPIDPVQQAKIDKINAEIALINQRASQEAERHANTLVNDAKRAEASTQQKQGQPKSNIPAKDSAILADNNEVKARAAVVASGQPKPSTASPVGGTSLPVGGVAGLPQGEPPIKAIAEPVKGTNVAVASLLPPENPPATTVISEAAAPASTPVKEGVAPPKWRGGSEGSALQLFGATKKTLEPKHIAGVEVFKDFVGGELAPSTGGTIKEFPQFTEFFKKHTGETLSPNAEGKYPRLTETQVSKLHSGIQSELENAVKGGKLKTLGKGAMAAAGLLGLTEAVQAAQKGDFGPLGEAGFTGLLTKAVGGVAATALTPSEAGAPIVGNTKQQQQNIEVSQRPGVRAYSEILKNRLSGEEYNKAISDFAATNPKRGDYAAMQELFRQQAEKKKANR